MKDNKVVFNNTEVLPNIAEDTDAIVERIIKMVKSYSPNANTDMIDVAYRLAKSAHKNQYRKSGEPYIIHPVQIAYIAAELSMDHIAICAGLLHDVIEDTAYDFDDIATLFGKSVAEIVDGITKLKKIQYRDHQEQQVENLRKMFFAMSKDIRVVMIKLIDRLHNMRTLAFMPKEKQLYIAKETLDVYAPLAHRLGISKIKSELEDLSLKYLDSVAYEEIADSINRKKAEREAYVSDIIETLKERMEENSITCEITGRAKHFYSIFRKMYAQNKTIDEIYDLFAVRIIVNTVAECYAVLGIVHDMYTPLPMRFKDYVAMPKPNMYQSLHTTVVGSDGTPFEIQIRTWDMHKVAQEGIAAHWKYKEGKSGADAMDKELEWVRSLMETQADIMDADVFMNSLKIDMFSDQVFAFTPQGKVIPLPNGSTCIDFAFTIHTQVGSKMVGAKANGKIVPNSYKLQNGDIIEILTSPQAKGPSRDWLKIVKTSLAKSKINQWLKKERREENIVHGKDMLEKEAKRLNVPFSKLFREEWLAPMYKKYNMNDLDDLYASVGFGGLSAQKVVMRLREEFLKEQKKNNPEKTKTTHVTRKRQNTSGIEVKGIDNCLVRLSKCCNPVPGDEIVGFITKGRGVSVHTATCPNIQPGALSEEDKNRFIKVSWAKNYSNSSYIATLKVEALDSPGMMMSVTTVLAEAKINCVSINARSLKDGSSVMTFGLEISDTEELKKAMEKIRMIPGVTNVERTTN
ncbi:MAG: bifunctional (p)ppGpp synthetase/guanosine-3',5'-bis(diphosphate) 3'-pyrophosphohydrolase [Ruminococcaceae bacterium]|nr:bifunctional (p)ppGpp synthetase/guanosine-3',5'-bis(diphosphate) 3'-pyrophosphohydrolase [Oscillospiraceae bacterium]